MWRLRLLAAQFIPHSHHPRLQLRREVRAGPFRSLGVGWRIDGIANLNLQRRELLKALTARPGIVKALNRHRNNRYLKMKGKNGGSLLERPGCAVDAALAFGVENEDAAVTQSEGAGAHGGNQVGIGIDDNHSQPARQAAHKAGAENFAGAHGKQVAEYPPWQNGREHKRVQVTLVIGRNDVSALQG